MLELCDLIFQTVKYDPGLASRTRYLGDPHQFWIRENMCLWSKGQLSEAASQMQRYHRARLFMDHNTTTFPQPFSNTGTTAPRISSYITTPEVANEVSISLIHLTGNWGNPDWIATTRDIPHAYSLFSLQSLTDARTEVRDFALFPLPITSSDIGDNPWYSFGHPPSAKPHLWFKALTNKLSRVELTPEMTGLDLKQRFAYRSGWSPESIYLIDTGTCLQDNRMMIIPDTAILSGIGLGKGERIEELLAFRISV